MTPAWRIYYSDGSTLDSTEVKPEQARAFGVITIVYPDPEMGRVAMTGWDWYYWVPSANQWWGSDLYGLLDRLLHREEVVALCQGRNVHNSVYRKIHGMAVEDPDFPRKVKTSRRERP